MLEGMTRYYLCSTNTVTSTKGMCYFRFDWITIGKEYFHYFFSLCSFFGSVLHVFTNLSCKKILNYEIFKEIQSKL